MLVKIQDLNKSFHGRQALCHLNLEIEENQIVGLLGPNGAGKSTLIKCINSLLVPDAGTIEVNGASNEEQKALKISYLPEKTYLQPGWTGMKAIHFFESYYPDFSREKALRMIEKMGLDPNAEIRTMSKGMQEKLQTALIMARRVPLYILDEPIGGVDPASRDSILDTILENFEEGSSMIISTHMIADIERILDRAVFMKEGCILKDAQADELRSKEGMSLDQYFRKAYASC